MVNSVFLNLDGCWVNLKWLLGRVRVEVRLCEMGCDLDLFSEFMYLVSGF